MFIDLDPAVLDDPDFKEDSVRELIITPILHRLGYRPSGVTRVVRSKSLIHPFIQIGTRKHPVTIIPDYTLFEGDTPVLILDAKKPTENILGSDHVQQAYSYAMHPEIRCKHFALCNGRHLVVYHIERAEPLLVLPFNDFATRWSEIEKHLAPRYLLDPGLREYSPDLGLKVARLGLDSDTEIIFPAVRLGLFGRVDDQIYTVSASGNLGGEAHCASFDFHHSFLEPIIACLAAPIASEFRRALSRAPFKACADQMLEVDIATRLGSPITGRQETFVPFIVVSLLGSTFDGSSLGVGSNKIPSHIFSLRRALLERQGNG